MLANLDGCEFTQKYFGKYLEKLLKSQSKGRFIQVANNPNRLEQRLRKLDPKLIDSILAEIGNNIEVNLLDDRLMNAWAELRAVSQFQKEGFTNIEKVRETADFIACLAEKEYAIQVTRINRSLDDKMEKYSSSDVVDDEPFGAINDIYARFENPLSFLFWDTLQDKNSDFRKWKKNGFTRCLVIVSGEALLQDVLIRHIACREIQKGIHTLTQRHFEELLWLPDLSNGAWFKIGKVPDETECWTDWCDNALFDEYNLSVNRVKENLNSSMSY